MSKLTLDVLIFLVVSLSVQIMSAKTEAQELQLPRVPSLPSAPEAGSDAAKIVPRSEEEESIEIIGGAKLPDNRFFVRIHIRKNRSEFGICSGLWISEFAVLTAAHCLCHRGNIVPLTPYVSNRKLTAAASQNRDWVDTTGFAIYPGFRCNSRYLTGKDLALLFVDGKEPAGAEFPQSARDGGLKTKHPLKSVNVDCQNFSLGHTIPRVIQLAGEQRRRWFIAGYGKSGDADTDIGELMQVDLQMNSTLCVERKSVALGCRPFHEFILGAGSSDAGNRDTCNGDSGAPVFSRGPGDTIAPIGVTSRAVRLPGRFAGGKCGAGGIYTHLGYPNVLDWLRRNGVRTTGADICR